MVAAQTRLVSKAIDKSALRAQHTAPRPNDRDSPNKMPAHAVTVPRPHSTRGTHLPHSRSPPYLRTGRSRLSLLSCARAAAEGGPGVGGRGTRASR